MRLSTTKTIVAAGKTCHQSDTLGPRGEQSTVQKQLYNSLVIL
jgi:hypothetical protein